VGGIARSELVAILEVSPLFSGLTKQQLGKVADLCRSATFSAGYVILQEGDPGAHQALIIIDGEARVVRRGRTISKLGHGSVIGEMSLIDGEPRSASVVATTAVEALTIGSAGFRKLLESMPAMGWNLLKTQTQRLRAADARLDSLG
jgi:CRP/FNR family transcriptional regulator, cyclic AMP receptor protein